MVTFTFPLKFEKAFCIRLLVAASPFAHKFQGPVEERNCIHDMQMQEIGGQRQE